MTWHFFFFWRLYPVTTRRPAGGTLKNIKIISNIFSCDFIIRAVNQLKLKWLLHPKMKILIIIQNFQFNNWSSLFRFLMLRWIKKSVRWVRSMGNIQNGATLTRREQEKTNCWKNYNFMYKKYSRRFIKFRLNHWWQMDYPGDAFHTFLNLDSVIYLAVNGTVTSLPVFFI